MKPINWTCPCGYKTDHVDSWSQHQGFNCPLRGFVALGRDETISAVRAFHRAGEQPHDLDLGFPDKEHDKGGWLIEVADRLYDAEATAGNADGRLGLRVSLLVEELRELVEAAARGDMPNTLKEAADLQYVLDGLLIELGADRLKLPVFRAVHQSNMSKYEGETKRREDGKILKGDNYQPADIRAMIGDTDD